MNVYNTLGPLCTSHPDVCLYATNRLDSDRRTRFAGAELKDIIAAWSETPSVRSIAALSDAYWITCCIFTTSCDGEDCTSARDEESIGTLVDCHYIMREVPKAIADERIGQPFWSEVSKVISNLKNRIRNRCTRHTGHPELALSCVGGATDDMQDIRDIAKGELTEQDDGVKYDEVCEELFTKLEAWANVTFKESALDKYLFNNECKTDEAREAAVEDIRHTYWLVKAWIVVSESNGGCDDGEDGIDENIKAALQVAKKMCDKVHDIQPHLSSFVELCYFCEYRVQVRNTLKEHLKLVSSIERLHNAVYGSK